jgi:hypothetical protein
MSSAIDQALWNANIDSTAYQNAPEHYQTAILEQYKLYVEMADRISARRGLTNTFFLTLNTLVFTIIGVVVKDRTQFSPILLALALAIALGQCGGWFLIVRSYRQLNSAKFKVIGALETRLPVLERRMEGPRRRPGLARLYTAHPRRTMDPDALRNRLHHRFHRRSQRVAKGG